MADQLDCALDLMRRLPPNDVEDNLASLIDIVPDLCEHLLSSVDQPLKIATDKMAHRDYLLCDYNRDGDSYRSPWTNVYDPHISDGIFPSKELRQFEIHANEVFDIYRDLYASLSASCCDGFIFFLLFSLVQFCVWTCRMGIFLPHITLYFVPFLLCSCSSFLSSFCLIGNFGFKFYFFSFMINNAFCLLFFVGIMRGEFHPFMPGIWMTGFASVMLIKKNQDSTKKGQPMKGTWDSIHVVEVHPSRGRADYKLTSTVMLTIETETEAAGRMNIGGNLTRQVSEASVVLISLRYCSRSHQMCPF